MSGLNHYVPKSEREQHEISEKCICAPKLVVETSGFRVDNAYYEHFGLDGREEERQVYQ